MGEQGVCLFRPHVRDLPARGGHLTRPRRPRPGADLRFGAGLLDQGPLHLRRKERSDSAAGSVRFQPRGGDFPRHAEQRRAPGEGPRRRPRPGAPGAGAGQGAPRAGSGARHAERTEGDRGSAARGRPRRGKRSPPADPDGEDAGRAGRAPGGRRAERAGVRGRLKRRRRRGGGARGGHGIPARSGRGRGDVAMVPLRIGRPFGRDLSALGKENGEGRIVAVRRGPLPGQLPGGHGLGGASSESPPASK